MKKMKPITSDIVLSFFRQFVNCWLAYTLSQPVDIDLSVALHFVRMYFGISLIENFCLRMKNHVVTMTNKNAKETIEELIPQESYSWSGT